MHSIELESLLADARRAGGSFPALWGVLGRHGVLRVLGDSARLEESARLLEWLGFHLEEGGLFISLIGGAALALPILEKAPSSEFVSDLRERALAGDAILAVAITEPGAGSDALAMRSSLRREGEDLILDGEKWNITNAPIADATIVFCRNETTGRPFLSAIVVPSTAPGVRTGPEHELIAAQNSPTGPIRLERVIVQPDWIVGNPEDGHRLLDAAFLRERLFAPLPLLGRVARALQEGIDWATQRQQFGRTIGEFQYVQEKLVTGYERLETSRLLAEEAIRRTLGGEPSWAHASLAKAHAAETAAAVFRAMIELRGSYGVQRRAGLGEALLDSICASIAGGTREIQRKVVWDELVLDRGRSRRTGRTRLFRHAAPARKEERRDRP